jgi:electron transfer flavoprotein alpha/beta subunit
MALNIIVCVKNTPTTVNVPVDPATGKVKREGLALALNPFDEFAVEEAVRLKEKNPGATATALTVGNDDGALREAVARGVDGGVQVAGPEFDGGDSYTTSYALAAALKKLHAEKPVSVVLFGKNTNDGGSGVVGAEVAAWLDWAGVTSIKKIEQISETSATVVRMVEDGSETLKVALPATLSTTKEINEPRLPSLKGKMNAKKVTIPKWGAADLALDASKVGAAGAPTAISKCSPPPARPAGMRIEGASAQEKAQKLVDVLIERKLI